MFYTKCFKTWASHAESTVCCACCRTIYPYEDMCFLCLQEYTEKLNCTDCCHAKVHTECTTTLTALLSLLTYDHSLECGQVIHCNQPWLNIRNKHSNSSNWNIYLKRSTFYCCKHCCKQLYNINISKHIYCICSTPGLNHPHHTP